MAGLNYRNLIENLYEGLFYIDKTGLIKYWSKGAEKITGYSSEAVLNFKISDELLSPTDKNGNKLSGEKSIFHYTLAKGTIKQFELLITHRDGYKIPISARIAPMYDHQDNIVGATQLFTDNKEHIEQLVMDSQKYRDSYFDPITKLPNQLNLEMSIDAKISEFRRYNRPFGILFIKIDDYEKYNEIYGDDFKIKTLVQVSKLLENDLRPFDVAGRWSDHEFTIILVNVREDSVTMIGNRLKEIIKKSEFTIGKGSLSLTLSVGGVTVSAKDNCNTLVKKLHSTLEKCELEGGDQFLLWSEVK
ncbi:MAG: diguanylate cyclase [Candidatus Cloacimonetes bacterium]|nr:diguanylate cyclase [Candidatus Cloacimonadota bacterium]